MTWRRHAAVALLCGAAAAAPRAADHAANLQTILTRDLQFSTGELADLARGRTVRHSLKGSSPGEIGVAGATRVNTSKSRLLDRVRDVATFKRGPDVLQIGTFSTPPVEADLAALTVDPEDFDVSDCRIHDCDVRLPADTIGHFAAIDPNAADAQAKGAALLKHLIFEQVSAYVSGRPGRFTQYDDGEHPIRPLDAFADLLSHERALDDLVPGLRDHLREFPAARLAGAQDVLYWSKEKFGFDPFITVTHMTIVCPEPALCVVASKDVYSTRYIDASLSLTIAHDAPEPAHAFDLVYVNRTRASALTGFFSGLRRSIAERRARSGLEERLKATRAMLER
jgi:hypothetical protein